MALCVAVALAAGVSLLSSKRIGGSEAEECKPTFRIVDREATYLKMVTWEFSFETAVIGCEADLESLSEEDWETVKVQLKKTAKEHGIGLQRAAREPDVRRSFCNSVNEALGRKVVSDVYVGCMSMTEMRPR